MIEVFEAFVYIWYDSKNRMYYIGKHKGTPDDGYTHSSSVMESFKSDEVPSHMRRRILAFGTHEEMCYLENKLLLDRKSKCWDRYYNESLGDPRVVNISGENHPNYKHGRSGTPEYCAEWYRENKEHVSEYLEKTKEHRLTYARRYYYENLERRRESQKKWIEENIEHHREYHRQYMREWRDRKKLEKERANSTSLDMFFA